LETSVSTQLFRFSEIAGAPNSPGVYAWYYRLELTDKDIADCIESVELEPSEEARYEIIRSFLDVHLFRYYKEVPYFVSLSGKLKPRYQGLLAHHVEMSLSLIKRLAETPSNLYEIKRTLRLAIPQFSSPIYIGVAKCLRDRLKQHVHLINSLQHLQASGALTPMLETDTDSETDRDHKFAYEVSLIRGFRPSCLIVNTLELPVDDSIRYDLENILNRINYPLCGRN
jgi:hypothetical protein